MGHLWTLSSPSYMIPRDARYKYTYICRIAHLRNYLHSFISHTNMQSTQEISAQDFAHIYATLTTEQIIDVRENDEYTLIHLKKSSLSPMSQPRSYPCNTKAPIYILCRSGVRSLQVTKMLRSEWIEAYNIAGGIAQLSKFIEAEAIVYGLEPIHNYLH